MVKIVLTIESMGTAILDFCRKYLIPPEYFLRIINDQKVIPMLRGKGMEYSAYLALSEVLDENEWSVQKLNLAAQTGSPDEDITITHRRSGIKLKIESKSAVRGSFSLGERSRDYKGIPHFKVKSHRSRSTISKIESGNDRYSVEDFDVIISNPENSIYQGNTASEGFQLLHDERAIEFIKRKYGVNTQEELSHATYSDWRFVLPKDIAENGFIPRTPYVLFENDPHWHSLKEIEAILTELIRLQRERKPRSSK